MANDKRTLSDEEREQRRAEQRELVRASIEQLRSSDGWQAYLKVRSRSIARGASAAHGSPSRPTAGPPSARTAGAGRGGRWR